MPGKRCPDCSAALTNPEVRCVRFTITVCSACGAVVDVPRVPGSLRRLTAEEEGLYVPAPYRREVETLRGHLRAMAKQESPHAG